MTYPPKMSSENALPALPLCECPLPNDYFARIEGFVERLVAAMTPRQGEFLWALLAMYLTVLLVRRADSLVERWIDWYFLQHTYIELYI